MNVYGWYVVVSMFLNDMD